jgi:hypothetical protein
MTGVDDGDLEIRSHLQFIGVNENATDLSCCRFLHTFLSLFGLDCTPELRHAGRRLIGDTLGMVDASLWISSRRAAGVW